ncbi:hypothetical protein IAU60_005423 [Kwoniella sp. DSM 27419]
MSSKDLEKDATFTNVVAVDEVNEVKESQEIQYDPVADSRLTRRFDLRVSVDHKTRADIQLLPYATIMYFFSSLDRSNYSNAKTDHMTDDLHFPKNGYAVVLTVFYVVFSGCGIPGMIITRKFGAHVTLPAFMMGFGAISIVVRALLGAFEAGFAPSLIFYLTTFYTRGELARRVAAFYSCLALAGAFSGLLSYGVFQIESGSLHGWQYLFLIEGGATFLVAVAAAFALPKSAQDAKFLSTEEKRLAQWRLLRDASVELNAKFQWRTFFSPVFEIRFWGYGTAGTVASNFLTIILQRFGYSVVKTNLWTVAPNIFAAVCLGVSSYLSDRLRTRSWFLMGALSMTFTGCVVLAYFACFLIAGGAFTPSVIFHVWHQNNDVSMDSRGFRVAALTMFANSGGIVSANIFLAEFAPKLLEGIAISLVFGMRTYWARVNSTRNKQQGVEWTSRDVPTEALAAGPADPRFRYFL